MARISNDGGGVKLAREGIVNGGREDLASLGCVRQFISGKFLRATGLSIEAPDGKPLVENLDLAVSEGTKLALIGMEGVGKSSILRAIAGDELINFKVTGRIEGGSIGYLSQNLDSKWENTEVLEYFLKKDPTEDIDPESWGYYQDILEAVVKVGLDPSFLDDGRMISSLSGGELIRIRMAKVLAGSPDVLLLDEPSNHLDLDSIKWLEGFIKASRNPIIYVSHDEVLLERTANAVLYIQHLFFNDTCEHLLMNVPYEEFVDSYQRIVEQSQKEADDQQQRQRLMKQRLAEQAAESAARSSRFVADGMAEEGRARRGEAKSAQHAAALKSRMQREEQVKRRVFDESIKLDFSSTLQIPDGKNVLDFSTDVLNIGDRNLAENLHLHINGPEKIVLVGKNGAGKTTLLKRLLSELTDRPGLKVGFLPQNYADADFPVDKTVIDLLRDVEPDQTKCRTALARMNFATNDSFRLLSQLSGGQRAKVLLLQIMLGGANVLLLDEPTTNLSPLSNPELRSVLSEFPGAVIAVSHDRAFIRDVATRVMELSRQDGLKEIDKAIFLD